MKPVENVFGEGQLFIIFRILVDFHYLHKCQHRYLKIMRLVLLKLEGDISKEIEPNIFLLNSSILMNFNRTDKLILNKYSLQIIWQICLPKHCLHQLLRNWYIELACVGFVNYMIDIEVSFKGRVQSGGAKF